MMILTCKQLFDLQFTVKNTKRACLNDSKAAFKSKGHVVVLKVYT